MATETFVYMKSNIKKFITIKMSIVIFTMLNFIALILLLVHSPITETRRMNDRTNQMMNQINFQSEFNAYRIAYLEKVRHVSNFEEFALLMVKIYNAIDIHGLNLLELNINTYNLLSQNLFYTPIDISVTGNLPNLLRYFEYLNRLQNLIFLENIHVIFGYIGNINIAFFRLYIPTFVDRQ